jgi:hypothetical protein
MSSFTQAATVSNGVYTSQFNAYDKMELKITDNYGIEYNTDEVRRYNFALGTLFFPEDIVADPANGTVGTVTIDTDGTVHIDGNVSKFTLTAIIPNGTRVSSAVEVRKN